MTPSAGRVLIRWAIVLGVVIAGAALIGGVDLALAQEDGDDATVEGFDEVKTEVFIHENGSATVTVDYRYRLDADNGSPAEWDELRADIEEREEAYLAAEERRWRDTLANAENETEREMNVSGFVVETDESSTPREYGHVQFAFEWESFAAVELNTIMAGDALDGYVLDEGTTLLFAWPETYNATEIEPEPDERRDSVVGWSGAETEFVGGEPRVDLIENGTNGTAGAEETQPDGGLAGALPWLAVAGLVVLVLVGSAGWWVRRDRTAEPRANAEREGSQQPTPSGPPPELLSNEERVLQLLEERGGRVKQQEVVSALDWTEAKTSQVVGGLREDGEIDVFRIGRENVLALPADETEQEQ